MTTPEARLPAMADRDGPMHAQCGSCGRYKALGHAPSCPHGQSPADGARAAPATAAPTPPTPVGIATRRVLDAQARLRSATSDDAALDAVAELDAAMAALDPARLGAGLDIGRRGQPAR